MILIPYNLTDSFFIASKVLEFIQIALNPVLSYVVIAIKHKTKQYKTGLNVPVLGTSPFFEGGFFIIESIANNLINSKKFLSFLFIYIGR